jgi:hypothetical protein
MLAAMPDDDLHSILARHNDHIRAMGESLIGKDHGRFIGAATGLLTSISTGVPVLGVFADKLVMRAFANSINARLDRELEAQKDEERRRQFVSDLASPIEAMIGQALIQIVRSQHNLQEELKEDLIEQLGGIRQDLEGFREDFARHLGSASVRIDRQWITGGATGISIGSHARQSVFIAEQHVEGKGSKGIVFR